MKTCYIIDDNVVVLTGGAISTIAAWKSGLITPGEPADAKKLADFVQLQYELRRNTPEGVRLFEEFWRTYGGTAREVCKCWKL